MLCSETLAILKWQKYLRTKQEIRVDLTKILAKCQTYFGNVGVGFNYNIGKSLIDPLFWFLALLYS